MGKAHRGVYAAFHVEFLVFLLQAEVFEHLHHIVHTEVAECYPVVPGGYFCYYLCIGYRPRIGLPDEPDGSPSSLALNFSPVGPSL